MSSKSIMVSLPEEQLTFLDENGHSPSKVLQSAAIILMERAKSNPELLEANKIIILHQKKEATLQKILTNYAEFIKEKGLDKEFDKKYPI